MFAQKKEPWLTLKFIRQNIIPTENKMPSSQSGLVLKYCVNNIIPE